MEYVTFFFDFPTNINWFWLAICFAVAAGIVEVYNLVHLNNSEQLIHHDNNFYTAEHLVTVASPGDILEVHCVLFLHHGIYLWNGLVREVDINSGPEFRVREVTLKEFCGGNKVRANNPDNMALDCFGVTRRPIVNIMKPVEERVSFEITNRNCEYYAILWRYGVGFNSQVIYPVTIPVVKVILRVIQGTVAATALNEIVRTGIWKYILVLATTVITLMGLKCVIVKRYKYKALDRLPNVM